MAKAATDSAPVKAAYYFYQWFRGAPADRGSLEAVHEFLGNAVSLEGLQRLEKRLRDNPQFIHRHSPLIERWRTRMEAPQPLSDSDAQQFMQEMFENFDHALLYDHGITPGMTHQRRGLLNQGDKTFAGSMPCWTLHYTVSGDALYLSERMEQHVCAGQLMLLKPEARYHYGLHPRADEWQHLWVLFQPRQHWPELLQWPAIDEGIYCLAIEDLQVRERIQLLFLELIALRDETSPYKTDLQFNRLEEILIRARELSSELTETRIDPRIQQSCEYMEARLGSKIVIDDVARASNLSPSRFAHLFKEQMGYSPKAWINNMRLQQARKLLLGSDASINAIGCRVGFEDPSHFTRHFKKNVGCSPRQFRQSFGTRELPGSVTP